MLSFYAGVMLGLCIGIVLASLLIWKQSERQQNGCAPWKLEADR